ncbi:uncharacterized protein LY79DRAFT_128302 [Colletotrichum navitas]|uniref:Uncharacterized protein n=1 Tax=Colletotrichum navitas TaxID=681940 RepID=A0AAD8V6I5_9PEZI|nr:uncharacterized protein LY79DRAFT_128302 [Colletotrichum navitas]KAK1594859.1 hypothetical protein LY79DRAFT_128302 [Colletotrichum navitas]
MCARRGSKRGLRSWGGCEADGRYPSAQRVQMSPGVAGQGRYVPLPAPFCKGAWESKEGGGSSQQAASYGLGRGLAIGALCISKPKQTRRLLPLVPARTYLPEQVSTYSTAGGEGGMEAQKGGGAEGTDGKKHGTDLSIVLVRACVCERSRSG